MAQALPSAARDAWHRARLARKHWAPEASPHIEGLLGGGLSNLSLLIRDRDDHTLRWVLRVPLDAPGPGVNRSRELAILRQAAEAGLAPPLLYAEEESGVLLSRYVTAATPRADATISDVATLIRRIHHLPWPATLAAAGSANDGRDAGQTRPGLDSRERLRTWRQTLGAADPLTELDATLRDALEAAIARAARKAYEPRVCHNDLLAANRILTPGGELLAIDWEYACLGDPFFDLAVVSSELDADRDEQLLRAYLQRMPDIRETQHLADQRLIYHALAVCWHTRAGSSPAATSQAWKAFITACTSAARRDTV